MNENDIINTLNNIYEVMHDRIFLTLVEINEKLGPKKEIEGLKKCLRSASLDRDRYKENAWHNDQEIERLKSGITDVFSRFNDIVWKYEQSIEYEKYVQGLENLRKLLEEKE